MLIYNYIFSSCSEPFSFFANRIPCSSTIFDVMVCSNVIISDPTLPCRISYCFSHWGGSVDYCWCSVGWANWIYKVLELSVLFVLPFLYYRSFILSVLPFRIHYKYWMKWFCRVQSWRTLLRQHFLLTQVLATFLSIIEIYGNRFGQDPWRDFCSGHLCHFVLLIGLP